VNNWGLEGVKGERRKKGRRSLTTKIQELYFSVEKRGEKRKELGSSI